MNALTNDYGDSDDDTYAAAENDNPEDASSGNKTERHVIKGGGQERANRQHHSDYDRRDYSIRHLNLLTVWT
ncbi:MAG: hypothetical protein R6U25_02450 [Alkalispirochaeta sp.]